MNQCIVSSESSVLILLIFFTPTTLKSGVLFIYLTKFIFYLSFLSFTTSKRKRKKAGGLLVGGLAWSGGLVLVVPVT